MPSQADRRIATREALLAAAGRVFAARGFHAATLDHVAAEAGLSKGAVYHHFAGKEALFLALADERFAARRAQAARLDDSPSGRDVVAALPFDRDWALLFLEFVVYAARRPEQRRALRERLDGSRAAAGPLAREVGAIANGVSIEALLDDDDGAAAGELFASLLDTLTSAGRR